MRVISKRISRNEFVSRKNGVIPSLVDMWILPDTLLNCGDSASYVFGTYPSAAAKMRELGLSPSLLEYKAEFVYQDHNYGLIVSDIIIPDSIASNITDYTDIYVNIPDGSGGYYDLTNPHSPYHYDGRKIMHGDKEVKILTYTTLNKWYTFFKEYYGTIKSYDNAIGLYEAEYPVKNDSNRKIFSDLDDLFNARGGKQMYDWIIENCMPHDDGKEVKNDFAYETGSASYVIPLMITSSIDDLGEMTIFSTKWKGGVDYHNRVGSGLGTVIDRPFGKDEDGNIIYDYETYIIKDNVSKGYEHDEYHENSFKADDWANFSEWYINNNNVDFATRPNGECVETYAYSPVNGRVLYNKDVDCESIDYTKKNLVLINGESADVTLNGDYVNAKLTGDCVADISLRNGIKLPVLKDGPLKYAELNGRRFYALKDGNVEKIYFIKKGYCCDQGSIIEKSNYVIYNGNLYTFTGNIASIVNEEGETHTYEVANGYFWHNGMIFYIKGNKVVLPYIVDGNAGFKELSADMLSHFGWKSISISGDKVVICYDLEVNRANVVTGYTDSKLDLLRRRKVNTDELGNELPGYFNEEISAEPTGYTIYEESKESTLECPNELTVRFGATDTYDIKGMTYNSPYDQCTLDILYQVGYVSELEFQKEVNGVKLYNGNYLESIKFYHKNENGNRIDETTVVGNDSRTYLKKYDKDGEFYKEGYILYCDITYYIGATLVFDEDEGVYKPAEGRHKGVKYVDTLVVTKSTGKFFMKDKEDGSFFNFTYYELKGNMADWHLDDFNDNKLMNMSYFEMEIMLFCSNQGIKFSTDYWERNNGMIVAPVFRTEYDLFSSTPQKTKSDIYIDRGFNSAFEKHIKLQEVHTLDDLIKYGNGYFKMKNY